MKNYNANNFVWFVLVGDGLDTINRGGSISFKGYTDHANAHGRGAGVYVEYVTSKDENGKGKGKWFQLDESRRRWQVRNGEQDASEKPITQYDFLKFSPNCEGSPNGHYLDESKTQQTGIFFRELNDERDAETALEADKQRVDAEVSALTIDEGTLSEIGAFIGVFRDSRLSDAEPDKVMRFKVREYASKKPSEYMKLLNAGDRPVRAIIRKGVADGTLTKRGSVYFWENTMLGADEDSAIATVLREPRMLEVLQKKVDIKTDVPIVKNKGGRPKGSTNKSKETENATE